MQFPSGNVDVMPRSPIEMDSVGLPQTRIAPAVGADTRDILAQLGYGDSEIDEMLAAGAVAETK